MVQRLPFYLGFFVYSKHLKSQTSAYFEVTAIYPFTKKQTWIKHVDAKCDLLDTGRNSEWGGFDVVVRHSQAPQGSRRHDLLSRSTHRTNRCHASFDTNRAEPMWDSYLSDCSSNNYKAANLRLRFQSLDRLRLRRRFGFFDQPIQETLGDLETYLSVQRSQRSKTDHPVATKEDRIRKLGIVV